MRAEKITKPWWQTTKPQDMPDYIKLNGKVYPIDDAISLGKMTADCQPATEQEYLNQKK